MSTLEALQRLDDGEFHGLCDELLRRLEPRFARLRSHGLNAAGDSIVGQPDSYVGDTAATCRIAFCYTVQEKGWWTKVGEDVRKAVAASESIEEIVVAFPRDKDREGPTKGENSDWVSKAREAAEGRTLSIYDGPEIARLLDSDHQDLRWEHLRIPFSRLSYTAILVACQRSNDEVLCELRNRGVFDQSRYVPRSADRDLLAAWQQAFRRDSVSPAQMTDVRLIALVTDSGYGKTSLLCSFTASLSPSLPVLLLRARDIGFGQEDALSRAVIQRLHGVLPAGLASSEEAEVAHQLRSVLFTVELDGLDEACNPEDVRKTIHFWLRSRLGRQSVLIVSSRREYWRMCHDTNWAALMPDRLGMRRDARVPDASAPPALSDPSAGLEIPGPFTEDEVEQAWEAAGRPTQELRSVSSEILAELRHPFTLRAFMDTWTQGDPTSLRSRADVLAAWLDARLRAEEVPARRLTSDTYHSVLREVAKRIDKGGEGSIALDSLEGLPRYDSSHPPGIAIERLIHSGVLEPIPHRTGRIRFASQAVHEFYLAEADADEVESDPLLVSQVLAEGVFSDSHVRLDRLGRHLSTSTARMEFVGALTQGDPFKAALVLRSAPSSYSADIRDAVVTALDREVHGKLRLRALLAVDLLGQVDCEEARQALRRAFVSPAECPEHLRLGWTKAVARLGMVECADVVYAYPWIANHEFPFYMRESLQFLRSLSGQLRTVLAETALGHIHLSRERAERQQAVAMLAHLGDDRLAAHLQERLKESGDLDEYENHALLALGTVAAAEVFAAMLRLGTTGSEKPAEWSEDEDFCIACPTIPGSPDLQYLLTPAFEAALERRPVATNGGMLSILTKLADASKSIRLLHRALLGIAAREGPLPYNLLIHAEDIDPGTWLQWWSTAPTQRFRNTLLASCWPRPDVRVEELLISCLRDAEMCGSAARILAQCGSRRAIPYLREALERWVAQTEPQRTHSLVDTLVELRDAQAVFWLSQHFQSSSETERTWIARRLGEVGTTEAEAALVALLDEGYEPEALCEGLILCGRESGLRRVVTQARELGGDGPRWLLERISDAMSLEDLPPGKFWTPVHDADVIAYLEESAGLGPHEERGTLMWACEKIDSENVRRLLRRCAADDCAREVVARGELLSTARQFLLERGDESVVQSCVLAVLTEESEWLRRNQLEPFPDESIAREVRAVLSSGCSERTRYKAIHILGMVGGREDAQLIRAHINNEDELLANVAHEAWCRLVDPLLLDARASNAICGL